jgi:hypothetical protein
MRLDPYPGRQSNNASMIAPGWWNRVGQRGLSELIEESGYGGPWANPSTLVAAQAYVEKICANEHIAVAADQIQQAAKTARISRKRFDGGDAGRADVVMATGAVTESQARFSRYQIQWTSADNQWRRSIGLDRAPEGMIDYGRQQIPNPRVDRWVGSIRVDLNQTATAGDAPPRLMDAAPSPDQVSTLISQLGILDQQVEKLTHAVDAAMAAVELFEQQYLSGRSDIVPLIAAQHKLFENQHRLIDAKAQRCGTHLYLLAFVWDPAEHLPNGQYESLDPPNNWTELDLNADDHGPLVKLGLPTARQQTAGLEPQTLEVEENVPGTLVVVQLGQPIPSPPNPAILLPPTAAPPRNSPR